MPRIVQHERVRYPSPDEVAAVAGIVRDPKDAVILASIVLADPDVAVTGDKDLLTEEVRSRVPICRCAEYLGRREFG